jgi:hypothetical protein
MSPELNNFYINWLGKADAYTENTLSDHFDKFTSLYVLLNAQYMQVMTELVNAGKSLPKDFKDKKAATEYIIQYLGSKHFINKLLNDQESITRLNSICEIIAQERFHIILDWGNPQRDQDIELLNSLRSRSSQAKGKAILSLLYHIRCNMFHGHKGYEQRQKDLLEPLNHLLRKTVVITFDKLNS